MGESCFDAPCCMRNMTSERRLATHLIRIYTNELDVAHISDVCSILHELRNDMSYRAIVDELIEVPEAADTRDTEAVKRIATAYLKLIFPNIREPDDISAREFKRYCLDRARKMRDTIKYQLGVLDVEYRGKDIPVFSINPKYDKQDA